MMKELESLKSISESQLIELHNSLRDEREQKHIYKQQLDHRIQQVCLSTNAFSLNVAFFFLSFVGNSTKSRFVTYDTEWS